MLREIAPELWVAETPLSMYGVAAGRRMNVVRLSGGELWIHSPAELTPELRAGLDRLGPVRFVVPASKLHGHLFMGQYGEAYPDVELFAAPGLERRRKDLRFDGKLEDTPDPRWSAEIDQALFAAHRVLPEVVFLHRSSGSLIVGDLVWNVTPAMARSARLWAGWRPGVRPTPVFRAPLRREEARRSIERILEWDFDRILIGHGEIVETGGREALRRAYP